MKIVEIHQNYERRSRSIWTKGKRWQNMNVVLSKHWVLIIINMNIAITKTSSLDRTNLTGAELWEHVRGRPVREYVQRWFVLSAHLSSCINYKSSHSWLSDGESIPSVTGRGQYSIIIIIIYMYLKDLKELVELARLVNLHDYSVLHYPC